MASTRKKSADSATPAPPAAAPAAPDFDFKTAAAAYASFAEERKALGDAPEPPQGDFRAALDTARKALPKLQSLRDAIVEALPKHPISHLDQLEGYIQAAWFSERLVSITGGAETGADKFNELVEEGRNLRKSLLTCADAFVAKGLLDETKVKAIRSGAGHDDLASDLIDLAALYNEAWPRVKGKLVEREEVDRSDSLGQELQSLLVLRKSDAAKLSPEEAKEQQNRSIALLQRAYDETARAVAYLRWHEKDAESFSPILFKAKRGRPPKTGETTAAPPPVAEADEVARTSPAVDEMPPF